MTREQLLSRLSRIKIPVKYAGCALKLESFLNCNLSTSVLYCRDRDELRDLRGLLCRLDVLHEVYLISRDTPVFVGCVAPFAFINIFFTKK